MVVNSYSSSPATGFDRVPVSLFLVFLSASSSFVGSFLTQNKKYLFSLGLQALGRNEFWRILTSSIVFATPAETIFGLILLYQFRLFERLFGSRKFASAVVFYVVVSTGLQVLGLWMFPWMKFVAPGPYSIIFGLFAHYRFDVPPTGLYRFFGIPFTDKLFVYIIGLQLLFADYPASLLSGLTGLISGLIFRMDFFSRLQIPVSVSTACSRMFTSFVSLFSSRASARMQGYSEVEMNPANFERSNSIDSHSSEQLINDVSIDNNAVQTLVMLGFTEAEVRRALTLSNNNIDIATNMLLDHR